MRSALLALAVLCSASSPAAADRIHLEGATAETCFTPGEDCAAVVIAAIGEARRTIRLLGYGFTSRRILDALVDAHRRGVDVRLVLDASNLRDRYSRAGEAAASGIRVAIDGSVSISHNKLLMVDDALVMTGSYNFTVSANTRNAENLVVVRGSQRLAERMAAYFAEREKASRPLPQK